jgi:uncharacterized repeat protein (TIGR04042 family)
VPEARFTVRWPDGSVGECWSPSLVVHDHLDVGATYAVEEFVRRTVLAMDEASERVRAKFGFACTSAAATADDVRRAAAPFSPDQTVQVLRIHPPLPSHQEGS